MLTVHHSDHPLLPFVRTNTSTVFTFDGETIGEMFTRCGMHPGSAPAVVTLDGMPLADWQNTIARPGGIVTLRMAAHGGDDGGSTQVIMVVAMIALLVMGQVYGLALGQAVLGAGYSAATYTAVGSAIISIGGQLVLRALMPAPSAKVPNGSASMGTSSPTYSLTGGGNQARPYQPMMLVMGEHRVYPDISAKPTSLFSGNENYLYQVFNYGLVPQTWSAHQIGETPVSSYSEITIVDGDNGAALSGIHQNTETIDGVGQLDFPTESFEAAPYGAWTQRTTVEDTTKIMVNLGAMCAMTWESDIGYDRVAFDVWYRSTGTAAWATLWSGSIASKNKLVRRTYSLNVPKGQYDVVVRARGDASKVPNDPKARLRTPYFFSIVCAQSEPASYAGQYRVGVKIRASGQLQGNIDRWSSLCQAQCSVWNGSAWVKQHTRNPAWWFYEIAKGRSVSSRMAYGAGLPDSRIDLESIKAWAIWCAAEGLSFDAVVDSPISLSDLLSRIAFAGMGSPTWATGKLGVVWQDRDDVATAVFGMFNIIKGSFAVNYISENLADEIEATFIDRAKDYTSQTIRVPVPGTVGTPQRPVKIDLFGITDAAVALRHARLQAAGQYYHRRRITWETDSEGLMVKRGDVVQLSHDLTQWDYSGRVVAWNPATKTLQLERPVPRTAADTIALRWPNGCVEYLACTPASGTSSTVTLVNALPTISDDGTVLEDIGVSQPVHDWAFQYGPRATPGKRVRIVGIAPSSDRTVKIEAVDEETGYYDYAGGSYTPPGVFAKPNFTPYALKASETLLRLTPAGSISRIGLSWEGPSAVTYVIRARVTSEGEVGPWADIGSATGNNFDFEADEGDLLDIEVAPFFDVRNSKGIYGKASLSLTVKGRTVVPSNVTGLSVTLAAPNVALAWSPVLDIDVSRYEVRRGGASDTWETATYVARVSGTSYLTPAVNIGTWRYFVKARDVLGLYSVTAAMVELVIAAPQNVGSITYSFRDTSLTSASITLDWGDVTPDLGLKHYEISYDTSSKGINASTITLPADWLGNRTFTVKTVDLLGNKSSGSVLIVDKRVPNPVSGLTAQVIDNNVLLYWTIPAVTSLPVQDVIVKKGATWETAALIGTKSGGFTSLQEMASGKYTYWVAVRDTDNNQSTPVAVSAAVSEPPDFVFHAAYTSAFTGAMSSAILEQKAIVLPVNTTETWAQHFTNNSWTTPQNQIDAGFPIFIQPAASGGYYEEGFDYGATLASSKVTVGMTGATVSGNPVVTTTISVSLNGSTWTDYAGFTSVYATNFRHVRVRIAVSGSGGDDLYKLTGLAVTLNAKLKNDAGTAAVSAADVGGTTVGFNIPFLDITSLTVTPQGTSLLTAVVDFTDSPNPTSFKVLLFNAAGARVSGTVYWNAKGY